MQILSRRTLRTFWEIHPRAEQPLKEWYDQVAKASWATPAEVKDQFGGRVDFVADSRAIFDIGGNKYRIVARIAYRFHRVLIKFVGTHKEYDRIDPNRV